MKKIVVFRVENVLVKGYEVERMFDVKMKKWLGERLMEGYGLELGKVGSWDEVMEKMEMWRRGFEEKGDVEKMIGVRDLGKMLEGLLEGKGEEMEGMRKKFVDGEFEKRKIGIREDLLDLERIGEVVGDLRMMFVSGYGRGKVERLLRNNGLRRFEVTGDLEGLEELDKEKVLVFGSGEDVEKVEGIGIRGVLGVKDMWREIGLKKAG